MVVSWIKVTIAPELSSSLAHHEIACDLWNQIKKQFSVKNGQRVQRLKSALANCHQQGTDVATYYGKLTKIWKSLGDFQQAKTAEGIAKEREEDKLHQFLMGLDESLFGAVKSSLLSRDPLPSVDEAYHVVTQDEDSKHSSRKVEERHDIVSFAVQTQNQTRPRSQSVLRDPSVLCSTCGRKGHLAANCFRKIGYPHWWGNRPRPSLSSEESGAAVSSSEDRRVSFPKPSSRVEPARAHQASTAPVFAANTALTEADRVGFSGLNDQQWKTLVHMLNERHPGTQDRLSGTYFLESWIIDSGASNHMTGSIDFLMDVTDMSPMIIKLPNGIFTTSTKQGSVQLGSSLQLSRVFFVDGLQCHLISVSQLTRDKGCLFQISDKICVVQDRITQMLIGAGEQLNGLYFFRGVPAVAMAVRVEKQPADVWHRRLGHPASKTMEMLKLPVSSLVSSFDSKSCDICIRAKQSRDSFPLSINKTSAVFQLVHCDLWGPYRTTSICGSRYFLTILDDYSRAVWIYLLPNKTETGSTLRNFIALVERQFEKQVKTIRSDNGSEFLCLTDYFREKGIIHETSCVGTPQQNGRVERKHRHILNVARALRFQAHLPVEFWSFCALTAGYLINRTPSTTLNGKTPFELLYGRLPPMNHLRIFGSLCYVHNQKHGGDKFAQRGEKAIFIGYPFGKKGWRVYHIDSGKISTSRDVVFCEQEFPFAVSVPLSTSRVTPPVCFNRDTIDDDEFFGESLPSSRRLTTPNTSASPGLNTPPGTSPPEYEAPSSPLVVDDQIVSDSPTPSEQSPVLDSPSTPLSSSPLPSGSPPTPEAPMGKGCRPKFKNVRLSGYVTNTTHTEHGEFVDTSRYPISDYVDCSKFSDHHRAFLAAITASEIPLTYAEAFEDENWRGAVHGEIDALEESGTWTVETLPPGKTALGCKWVFTLKYRADGTLERYKARLVVLGNKQTEGIDYNETFAPVCKMVTVRSFLEVAVSRDWEVHQMDVHNAFLHGDLDEEVFIKFPPGFRTNDKNLVCRLHKSLYGLKQAPRCWFAKLTSALKDYGFEQNLSDYSLFIFNDGTHQIHVLIYVDDLIVTGNSPAILPEFKQYLSSCFKMKDLGVLKYFLGIEVARSPQGMYLCQRKYALDLVSDAGLLGAKPASHPIEQNHRLATASGPLLADPTPYRRLVGKLIYLAVTRPELSYAIQVLSQFMHAPKAEHWAAALRVVRYIKGSPGQGILLRANVELCLKAWCDADWAGCPLSRRSLTGWIIQLGDSPISWKTRKQRTVSRSSAEAEYRAMAETVSEVLWLRELLAALGVDCLAPVQFYCDSQAAIHLSKNPVFHERTKHIESDCHFIRDEIVRGVISPIHVSTATQLADIFTKALGRKEFAAFVVKMGIRDLHTPS